MTAHIRYAVTPRDVPIEKAARRLHLTKAEFERALPDLYARQFPRPDETTGMFDLKAIDAWCDRRYPQLLLTKPGQTADPAVLRQRLGLASNG